MALTADQKLNQDTSAQRAMGLGLSGGVKVLPVTVTDTGSASGTTVDLGFVPSSARIIGGVVYCDDLATSGSPTLDLGTAAGAGNYSTITADPDAIGNGIALSAANYAGACVFSNNLVDAGKRAWEIAGLSADCGGTIKVYGSVVDAPTNASGYFHVDLLYTVD